MNDVGGGEEGRHGNSHDDDEGVQATAVCTE